MNFSMIKLVVVTSVISLAGIAQAQGVRDAGSKIRGDYGMTPRSQTFYTAPRAVYQASAALAQAPVERRSFSQAADQLGVTQPAEAVEFVPQFLQFRSDQHELLEVSVVQFNRDPRRRCLFARH